MDTIVGAAVDGTGRAHLVLQGSWRTACGAPLPARWLPQFGAEVTCKSCRRTVAFTARGERGDCSRLADERSPRALPGHEEILDASQLWARAARAREAAMRARADHRRAQQELHRLSGS